MIKFIVFTSLILIVAIVLFFMVKAGVKGAKTAKNAVDAFSPKVITEQVVALGAPALPDDVDYEFYTRIAETGPYTQRTYKDAVVIRFDGKKYISEVDIDHYTKSVENKLVAAASYVHSRFLPAWEADQKRKRLEELVNGDNRLVLGEKQPWKDDK